MKFNYLSKISFLRKYKYIVVIVFFIIVVGFINPNSFYNCYKLQQEANQLQREINSYREKYIRDTQLYNELSKNPKVMERIARERYFMKKPNEDIYVFK